ncbi:MAG: hypothetical protein DIJKHBIC_02442 [Thermoanaerobaculia bacterium]|nr:hypothetical protein [Thermoanaerobaculia bacterium]
MGLLVTGHFTGVLYGDAPLWIWALTVVGVDVAHVWATAYRTYLDREEFSRRSALYLAIPAGAYAAGVVAHSISPLFFWRVLAYIAVFHFVRQQYGWVVLYRRKNGETDEPRAHHILDSLVIYGSTVVPLLYWHAHLPRKFHWFLAGDFLTGLSERFFAAGLVIYLAALTLYAAKEFRRSRAGRRVSWGKQLVIGTTAMTWFSGIVVFDSDYAFTVTNVLVHGIPYFGIVLASTRQRAALHAELGRTATVADRLSATAAGFMIPLLAVAFLEEWGWDRFVWHENGSLFPGPDISPGPFLLSLVVPLLALPQATHYLLDAWIWKIRPENREAAASLGLSASREAVTSPR